jgi:hypothetical protein
MSRKISVPPLLTVRKRGGEIEFCRTEFGQFFYDLVLSKKSEKYLARKWRKPIKEIRVLRRVGRKALQAKSPAQNESKAR